MSKLVIFACVHNAGRSQMASAFFNQSPLPGWMAASAGTQPAPHVHPVVIEVMKELGIDLGGSVPQRLTPELAARASLLVTMGCGEDCPYVPGLPVEDWPLDDPKGRSVDEVRVIRDSIRQKVADLQSRLARR